MEEKKIRIMLQGGTLYINKDDLIHNLSVRNQRVDGVEVKVIFLKLIEYIALITK